MDQNPAAHSNVLPGRPERGFRRTRNCFDPCLTRPFRLSRSKLALFLSCPRCFYLDRRLGVDLPRGFPFSLNYCVDTLLKREFDAHRQAGTPHPLMQEAGVEAVPFYHPDLEKWRDALRGGISYLHSETNLLITGGVDDIWVNPAGELIVVDYKATSKVGEVTLDADWQEGYKQQVEVYQWLLRKKGFSVSDTAYFVYCNADSGRAAFEGRMEFRVKLLPYVGSDSWVESAVQDAHACLLSDTIPQAGEECDYCRYRSAAGEVE